jgi:hypothetical protein
MGQTQNVSDPILFSRRLAQGPVVRIRRTSDHGAMPVVAVLEVDRRAGTAREAEGGFPPPLMTAEGASEEAVLAVLSPHSDDRSLAVLMHQKGLR